ncbi:MAG: hypothetical protein KIY11_08775 [Thermoplasmata archaeon]|nr:hypothetical protein [Candidatus Sysuiplasma acidicola]
MTKLKHGNRLGPNEATLYRWLVSLEGNSLLVPKDAMQALAESASQNSLAHTLSLLNHKGIIKRIGKGVYINESRGHSPGIIQVVPYVFKPLEYYIGLNAAASHWGLTTQIPHSYHIIYNPGNHAQMKRVARWCQMLKNEEENLGGELIPVVSNISPLLVRGVSHATIEGTQIPVSTLERTIIDSVIYTEKIGGAGEALTWAKFALNRGVDFNELSRVFDYIYPFVVSVAARLGFLLEMAQEETVTNVPAIKFVKKLEKLLSTTSATYNWGPEKGRTEYFRKWRLHVSRNYLDQFEVISVYE